MKSQRLNLQKPSSLPIERTIWLGEKAIRTRISVSTGSLGWVLFGKVSDKEERVARILNERGYSTLRFISGTNHLFDRDASHVFSEGIRLIQRSTAADQRIGLLVSSKAAAGASMAANRARDLRSAIVAVGKDIHSAHDYSATRVPTLFALHGLDSERLIELRKWIERHRPFLELQVGPIDEARIIGIAEQWFGQHLGSLDNVLVAEPGRTFDLSWARTFAASALLGFGAAIAPTSASAQSHSVDGSGEWNIVGTPSSDNLIVQCIGGNAQLNNTDPSSGVIPCTSIFTVVIDGQASDDVFDLGAFGEAEFSSINTTNSIVVAGGAGQDEILASGSDLSTGDQFVIDWEAIAASVARTNLVPFEIVGTNVENFRVDLQAGDDDVIVETLDGANATNGFFLAGGTGNDQVGILGDPILDDVLKVEPSSNLTTQVFTFEAPNQYAIELDNIERVDIDLRGGNDRLEVLPFDNLTQSNAIVAAAGPGSDELVIFGKDAPTTDDILLTETATNLVVGVRSPVPIDVPVVEFEKVEVRTLGGDDIVGIL
ncbi:MAG: hypothetical protein HKN13_02690, partial [Rhodothermales bacterium]|nr:hypothetical protein [Rhodothermales bacterium]